MKNNKLKGFLKVIGIILFWCLVAWPISRSYYLSQADKLIKQETRLSQERAKDLTDSIKRNLNYLSGIPEYFSHDALVKKALSRFGPDAMPSPLSYEKRKARWANAREFNALRQALLQAQKNFQVDIIFVQNAAGDVIAASNWDMPGSSLGQNLADREYFEDNKEEKRGYQYAVGKTTHIAGLYFSYPVVINGKFVGSVVAKSDVPKLTFLIKQSDAFVTDTNGVIILSHDENKELLMLPGSAVRELSMDARLSIYQKTDFSELHITPWGDKDFASLLRVQGEAGPHIFASGNIPEYGLTVYVESELNQFLELNAGQTWFFLGISGVASLLSLLVYGGLLHIRTVNQASAFLADEKKKYEMVMQSSGDGIHLVDANGNVIDVNDKFCKMLGYSREEMLRMNIIQWDAKFSPAQLKVRLEENFSHGAIFETKHRRKDGTIIDVEISAKAIEINGQLIGWHASRDITERKLYESILHQSEEEYRHLIEMLPYGVLIHRGGVILLANKTASLLFGAEGPSSLVGIQVLQLVHPDYREIVRHRIEASIEEGKDSRTIEEKLLRPDGSVFDAEVTSISVLFENKPASLAVFIDITERKRSEDELRLAASVYNSSSEGMLITDADNRIVAINPAFTALTGYELDEVIGKTPKILQSGRHSKEFYTELWAQLNASGSWHGEVWNRRKDGAIYPEHLSINVEKREDGSVHRYVALFSDITDQKRKEELIWSQANFDTLTGLPNRRLFHDRLEQETKKIYRTGASLALLFIDLDRFKEINDTLGHAKGDVLLVEASHRILKCIRKSDSLARLGGDEFTVILPEIRDISTIDRIVQVILTELATPFDLGDEDEGHISASIGIAIYPEDANSMEELMQHADQAMYAAKLAGRNRFSYFTLRMQLEAQDKMSLINDLRHALKNGELEVYYQPIVEARTGNVVKAEALLRWHHPVRGLTNPGLFVPLAEESGLILEIGEWVFHEAIGAIKAWQVNSGQVVQVSVNKSPVQFVRADRHSWLERLAESGLPKSSITVEITEGILISDSDKVREELLVFQQQGIEVSIDDFGTGFSALSYLNQFDVDYLKIDISFVRDINTSERNKALTEAIIVMAHKLGIKTVAEGVETREQSDVLTAMGCDYLQGYYYSRPVTVNAFEKLLHL